MPQDTSSSTLVVEQVLSRVTWDVGFNRKPDPASQGSDLYSCYSDEFPDSIGYGSTAEIARAQAESTLRRHLESSAQNPARQRALVIETVQLNVRVPVQIKAEIERRAKEEGVSIGKYIAQLIDPRGFSPSKKLQQTIDDIQARLRRLEQPQTAAPSQQRAAI